MTGLRGFLHDLETLPGDAWLAYRRESSRGVWKAVAQRSLHRVFRAGRLTVFVHPLDWAEAAPVADIDITRASESDLDQLAGMVGQRELRGFRSLLASGRICFIAWRGRRPLGYAWVAGHPGPDVTIWPLPFEFPDSAAYFCKLYVLPSERRSGIGSALAAARIRWARAQGFREGWRLVSPTNRGSLRTVQKSASRTRVLGEVRFVQVFGRTYTRFLPASAEVAQ